MPAGATSGVVRPFAAVRPVRPMLAVGRPSFSQLQQRMHDLLEDIGLEDAVVKIPPAFNDLPGADVLDAGPGVDRASRSARSSAIVSAPTARATPAGRGCQPRCW
jgi:hypothetical protein